jgi:integrase
MKAETTVRTEGSIARPGAVLRAEKNLERNLKQIGPSEAVERFLSSYGKVRVRDTYSLHLLIFFRWLKEEQGVQMSPDELVQDNLICVFDSKPTDVGAKRRHREWLERFVNVRLVDHSMSYRAGVASTVKKFYSRNDSPLFGEVRIAESQAFAPDKALKAEDIRAVLKALPPQIRTPLLLIWQSSCEVNRVLALRWKDVAEGLESGEYPLKLRFVGRKNHKSPWYTFLGRNSIEHLKLWRQRWTETAGREPSPDDLIFEGKTKGSGLDHTWLNRQLRKTALRMKAQGLIENGNPPSWRSHLLRHSFKTEAEHAEVKSALVEFFMGHEGGIQKVYDNRDEVHPGDMRDAYLKIEPHVSLDYSEIVMRQEFDEERKSWLTEIAALRKEMAAARQSPAR